MRWVWPRQVEEARERAVRQAWEEQLRSQLSEDEEVKQDLARKRMEAVREAVESERFLLEKKRQEAELQERIAKEKEFASFLMDEKGAHSLTHSITAASQPIDSQTARASQRCVYVV